MCYYSTRCPVCGLATQTLFSRCCPPFMVCNTVLPAPTNVACATCRARFPGVEAPLLLVPNTPVTYELPGSSVQPRYELPAATARSTAQQPYSPLRNPQSRSTESWLDSQSQTSSRSSNTSRPSTRSRGTQTDSRITQHNGQVRRSQPRSGSSSHRDYAEDSVQEVQRTGNGNQASATRSGPHTAITRANGMVTAMTGVDLPGGVRMGQMVTYPDPSRSSRSGGHRQSSSRRDSPVYEEEEDDYNDRRHRQ
ncbi:hypothetical protein F5Y18DRAFT_213294 [Xylariaceae sp. FL1019]|nr:hypothetical protein F5Y18DRAFT_213294 [Xylariaceae sp. FL1019]